MRSITRDQVWCAPQSGSAARLGAQLLLARLRDPVCVARHSMVCCLPPPLPGAMSGTETRNRVGVGQGTSASSSLFTAEPSIMVAEVRCSKSESG
eukprot:1835202-Rhodomonas_salina.3